MSSQTPEPFAVDEQPQNTQAPAPAPAPAQKPAPAVSSGPASPILSSAQATPIAPAGNYEVRPEGVFIFDNATAISDGDDLVIDYAFGGYDLIEALTTAAPVLEMSYAGVNEADNANPSTVDLFRVQLGATKSLGLIDKDFGTLDIEGEVLMDPTKTGAGLSRFFRVQMV